MSLVLALLPFHLSAQQGTGRIVGRALDASSGQPIPSAQVTVEGTAITALTDWSGRYTLDGVPAGIWTVSARTIGYAPKTVTEVLVPEGGAVGLDITLTAAAIQVTAVEVTAQEERGSVARALNEQRNASGIINAVSAEQIRRSPDSDAGQVMQRVSGVTVQDGKYVFVRGLGERYTTTSLNSARLPSPEPDRKVVPLDLFPAGLLQSIVTSKTFTPDQPGDFSGAQVDLRTREFPVDRMFVVSLATGFNGAALAQDVVAAPRVGTEWLGFAGAERDIPALAEAAGNLSGLSPNELNDVAASFRSVWSPWTERAKPNGSFGLSLGGEDIVLGRPLGYVASASYSESQEVRRDEQRATTSSFGGVVAPLDTSRGSTGVLAIQWGGLLNLTTRLGATTALSLNNTFTRTAENEATRHFAYDEEFSPNYGVFDVTRLTFVERTMRSNQLRGDHLLAGRHALSWTVTSSGVSRYEPDRSDLRYETDSAAGGRQATAWFGQARSAVRTFSDLNENALEGAASLRLGFGAPNRQWSVKVGGSYRRVDRTADSRAFTLLNHPTQGLSDAERRQPAEAIFTAAYARDTAFLLSADAQVGRYAADEGLGAGFVQFEVPLTERVRVIGGARVERWALDLDYATGAGDTLVLRRNTDVLPAISVHVKLSNDQALRLSASQTLARPEYREIARVYYRDFIGGLDVFGEPSLERSLIRNFDARWEWYPNPGELIGVSVFGKQFDRPIEKVIVGTTGGDALSYTNADGASSVGVELEVRKHLLTLAAALAPFSVFANATVMRSRIQPGSANLTNANRPMVGQAGYVVNGGLTFTEAGDRVSTTLLYNVVGRRVREAGSSPRPDTYEEARHMIDFSLQAPLGAGVALKFDAKNLLDAPVHVTQGPVTRHRYTTGRVFSLGATWQP
ncbi:MAG: carboxypeptidase regulatory-like domain-containing protein [Gemmatimonadales bacterium]|nr:carboxypeptidase regulatory-like domain-containing protein [Gemmatimonadales bacterium]